MTKSYIAAGCTSICHSPPACSEMSAPSSPSSECSTLEFEADPKVVKMLVMVLTCRHGILHYHGQTGELATYQWRVIFFYKKRSSLRVPRSYRPTDRYGHKIHPSQFAAYREVHAFRYPCCLCATGDRYVEASVFQCTTGVCQGQYFVECATSTCGYMRKLANLRIDNGDELIPVQVQVFRVISQA